MAQARFKPESQLAQVARNRTSRPGSPLLNQTQPVVRHFSRPFRHPLPVLRLVLLYPGGGVASLDALSGRRKERTERTIKWPRQGCGFNSRRLAVRL